MIPDYDTWLSTVPEPDEDDNELEREDSEYEDMLERKWEAEDES
ncbi:hypothetical protein ABVF11_02205 [Pediococcus argentinicus]